MPKSDNSRSQYDDPREVRRAAVEAFDRTLGESKPHTPVVFLTLAGACVFFLRMEFATPGDGLYLPFADDTLAAWGANLPALTAEHQGWRLFASIFAPLCLLQLLFNGWTLVDLGRLMERLLGSTGFLLVFLTAGFAGNLAHVIWEPDRVAAGSTGAIFGLLAALAGWMIRDRQAIPPGVTSRLRRSVPAFVAFNVGYGLLLKRLDATEYLGGVFAGLTCGLILYRPLAAEATRRWRGNLVVGLLAAALVVTAGYAVKPPPSDVRGEQDRLVELEGRLLEAYNAAHADFLKDKLTPAQYADKIDDEILPPWRAARARLEALPRVAEQDQARWNDLKKYAGLREHALALVADALRSGDEKALDESLKQAKEMLQEADQIVEALRKRDEPKAAAD